MRFFIKRDFGRNLKILAVLDHRYKWLCWDEVVRGEYHPGPHWGSLGTQTADSLLTGGHFFEVNPLRVGELAEWVGSNQASNLIGTVETCPEIRAFLLFGRPKTTMKIGVPKAKLP